MKGDTPNCFLLSPGSLYRNGWLPGISHTGENRKTSARSEHQREPDQRLKTSAVHIAVLLTGRGYNPDGR